MYYFSYFTHAPIIHVPPSCYHAQCHVIQVASDVFQANRADVGSPGEELSPLLSLDSFVNDLVASAKATITKKNPGKLR